VSAPRPEPDATVPRHYPGCEWLCGDGHRTTWRDYRCGCTVPVPSKARGQHGRCTACDAAIPELMEAP
jgi:hypothetical protein